MQGVLGLEPVDSGNPRADFILWLGGFPCWVFGGCRVAEAHSIRMWLPLFRTQPRLCSQRGATFGRRISALPFGPKSLREGSGFVHRLGGKPPFCFSGMSSPGSCSGRGCAGWFSSPLQGFHLEVMVGAGVGGCHRRAGCWWEQGEEGLLKAAGCLEGGSSPWPLSA